MTGQRLAQAALFRMFVPAQHAGARYVLSVYTGSWALAQADVIDGKRARTNKATFNTVVARYMSSELRNRS